MPSLFMYLCILSLFGDDIVYRYQFGFSPLRGDGKVMSKSDSNLLKSLAFRLRVSKFWKTSHLNRCNGCTDLT